MATDLADSASMALAEECLEPDGRANLGDDGRLELPPLPCDPLPAEAFGDEPAGLVEGADGGDPRPDHLPSEILAGILPDPFLVAELTGTDPREVDEYHLVEMIAGCARVAAWMQWTMASLAARLSRRVALNPRGSLPTGEYVLNVTAQELAPRLGISKLAARRMVEYGRMFGLELEDTGTALQEGRIDYPKACAIARLLRDQPGDVAWAVQQEVLPNAPHQTVTQLERAVSRAIIAIDPLRATARHKAAREQRRVHHPRPLPNGMASLTAILPATDAAGLDLALETAARSAKAAGDTRTIDQLRADALALLGHGALEHGFIGVPEADGPGVGTRARSDASADPAENLPADDGQDLATGQAVEAQQEPGCDPTADAGCGTDSGPTADADMEPAAPPAEADQAPGSGPLPDAAPVLHTGNAFLRTPHMPVGAIGGRRAHIRLTVPLSVLIPFETLDHCPSSSRGGSPASGATSGGVREEDGRSAVPDDYGLPADWYHGPPVEVAELDGYGPITPDVARALAHSGGTWQRLVTDPLSGELLDVGRTRYRPPAPIADFVRNRDGTCVVPACSSPAASCQLDHVVPWEFGGVTSAENLALLCTGDHPPKTVGAFTLRHLGGGDFEWTTPTGHRYLRERNGRITALARRGAAGHGDDPSEPPY